MITKYKSEVKQSWAQQHNFALQNPHGFEVPIVMMLDGLESYLEEHFQRYESTIFEDYVLVEGAKKIAEGIRVLLDGETGRLDCGTIDTRLVQILRTCGEQI